MSERTSVYERKGIESAVKDVDKTKRVIVGKFADYQTPDLIRDLSFKGMFDKSWKEAKARVKLLYEHDTTKVAGKIQDLWDDNQGAYHKSIVGTHKFGNDILEMADAGLINEHSYGYIATKAKKNDHGGRDLKEVMHLEVTLVGGGWAIHGNTPLLSVTKALNHDALLDKLEARYKSLDKFCHNATASDETLEDLQQKTELLLLEIKQLHQYILDSTSSTQAAEKALEPPTGSLINTDEVKAFIEIQKQLLITL